MACTSVRLAAPIFLSTPSARRTTRCKTASFLPGRYFYPRPPRGGRPVASQARLRPSANFYPRPPRGGRLAGAALVGTAVVFLSTPSARRATSTTRIVSASPIFLSTPSARRATRETYPAGGGAVYISIHALREEGDVTSGRPRQQNRQFLSTPSARRATCGAGATLLAFLFLSTPSARRATKHCPRPLPRSRNFYPRPPRGGRRPARAARPPPRSDFYPRPPRGGRQQKQRQNLYFQTNYTTFCTNLEEL